MNGVRIYLGIILSFFLLGNVSAYDQVFDTVKLRYGYSYFFNDSFKNTGNVDLKLKSYKVTFREELDFNNGVNPTFTPSQAVKQDPLFSPGEKKVILESSPAYPIFYHPIARKSNNIEIIYETTDQVYPNGKLTTHTEYQPYMITWCGDGVVDNYIDQYGNFPIVEVCDPGDPNKVGWGNGGCNINTCTPITVPTPTTCDSIDVKPTTGNAPVTSNISCNGTNASSFKIQIEQGSNVLKTFNSKTATYNFQNAGDYTVRCFVNNTITSPACRQSVIIQPPIPQDYDLALRKTLSTTTPGPFKVGDSVTFNIRVFNQGDIASGPVTITDYIPAGLTLSDTNWTQTGNTASRNITNIPAGGDTTLTIRFTINPGITGTIRNFAEISTDSGDDCDSTPDATNGNGAGETTELIDDAIGNGCNPGGDEDDHDIAEIVVGEDITSACINLTATPSSARNSLTSTLTCTGDNATSYKIEVRNPAGALVNTINSASGQVTLPLIGGTNTNYTAQCFVNNETTTPAACQKTLSVTTGGGGGGSNHSCVDISRINSTTVRCFGNNANLMGITYSYSGSTFQEKKNNLISTDAGRVYADFTLPTDASNIQCLASKNGLEPIAEGLQDWRGGPQCRFNTNPVCGDGIVDPGEQCDLGINDGVRNVWNGKPGAACSTSCKLPGGGGGSHPSCSKPGILCIVQTTPDEGMFRFGPSGDVIVGHKQNPIERFAQYPVLENSSRYDLSFDKLCITSEDNALVREVTNGTSDGKICVNIENRTIYPGEKLYIVNEAGVYKAVNQYKFLSTMLYPKFEANKDVIPSNQNFKATQLITSIQDGGIDYKTAFFAGKLNVRVAKPVISTTGGGTSYVKSTTTGDVAKVTAGIAGMIVNTNFVGTSVSTSGVSSDAKVVTDTTSAQSDSSMKLVYTGTSPSTTSFEKYNGLENVFIKKGNHTFNSTPVGIGARTYIIENGNLIISGNIISTDNIAFIVRNGDIIIGSDVEKIDATLMILDAGFVKGNPSEKQLKVNGAIYGNIDNLVDNRYYIGEKDGVLSVGTIVSFGSNLLRKPAPLLSQFIGEYLNSQRVAK